MDGISVSRNVDIGLILQTLSAIVAVVWTVSQIKATTNTLRVEISSLGRSLDQLRELVRGMNDRMIEHEGRIGRIEGSCAESGDD